MQAQTDSDGAYSEDGFLGTRLIIANRATATVAGMMRFYWPPALVVKKRNQFAIWEPEQASWVFAFWLVCRKPSLLGLR